MKIEGRLLNEYISVSLKETAKRWAEIAIRTCNKLLNLSRQATCQDSQLVANGSHLLGDWRDSPDFTKGWLSRQKRSESLRSECEGKHFDRCGSRSRSVSLRLRATHEK